MSHATPRRQRGLTLIGFALVGILVIGFVITAMKVVPAYIEFYSIKQIFATLAKDPEFARMDNQAIRLAFAKRANVDYVTVVKSEQLRIERSGGVPKVSVAYEFRTGLVGNVSLVIDFFASTDPNAQPRHSQ